MIRVIAAIDEHRGLIPTDLHSSVKLVTDKQYFASKTSGHAVLMGYQTYVGDLGQTPLPNRKNFVVVRHGTSLRPGFEAVEDVHEFLKQFDQDIWIIGGAKLFADTLTKVAELYLTELVGDFHCTKFFPEFHPQFRLKQKGNPMSEQGITFRFSIYQRI